MIIEKIQIKSFGQLKDTTLEFSETVNVIEGQNEAGKSTIAAFIKYMLYGFDGQDPDEASAERRRRINWDTGIAEGAMTVRVKGKRYLITRSTVRVSEGDRPSYKEDCSIIDMETGTPAFGKLPAGEVFFGVDKELFENTAFVGELGEIRYREGSVRRSIENILFSGSEKLNTERAIAGIREKMESLLHEGGEGGAIVDLVKKQNDLEEQLHRSDEDNKQILTKEAELHEVRKKKAEAEKLRENLSDLDTCYKNVMVIETFDKLHELEKESDKKNEEYRLFLEENTHNNFVPTADYLTDLAVARRGVNDAYVALTEAQENYKKEKNAVGITNEIEGMIERADGFGGENSLLSSANKQSADKTRCIVFAALGGLWFLASLIFEFAATGVGLPLKIIVGILGVGALAVTLASLAIIVKNTGLLRQAAARFETENLYDLRGKLRLIAEARNKRDSMIRSTENARMMEEAAEARCEAARNELSALVGKTGEEIPADNADVFLNDFAGRIGEFLKKKDALEEDKNNTEITVREIRRSLSDKSEIDIRAQVPPIKRKALAGINHDEIINGIANCKEQVAEYDRQAFRMENELAALKLRAADPGELYSKIQLLEGQIEALRTRHKAYFLALRTLEGATEALRTEISPRLGDFSTKLLSIMTDEKYRSFSVGDDLGVSFTAVTGDQKSVDFLSGGTQDLTYIAVRMALVDMLYTEKTPLCFDESFSRQDNLRARSMMKAIAYLSGEGYQSFIFTCRNRETVLAGEMKCGAAIFKLSVDNGATG